MWGDRSGREPVRARSPLRLRRATALVGAVLCGVAAVVIVTTIGTSYWLPVTVLAVAAVAGLLDAGIITHRLRSGRSTP
ncbi:DUF6343 family protein [Aeromicrobium sp. CTD01-1L150]|uniref:DUF6343 family protein n=1 Tax=Aeromicrobium sp. CTD01-1L150 TaxID=3341830 RepID=UPI0035BF150B